MTLPLVPLSSLRRAHPARAVLLGVALALAAPAALAQDAGAPPPAPAPAGAVNAEVVVLLATNDGSGIDPKIGEMPELGKPPFSSYNSYKLLDRAKLALGKGAPTTTKLPNDGSLMVTLKDILPPKDKDPKRFVVGASIQKPGGKSFLPLLEVNAKANENFFVAGQSFKGGVLVIGIKVLP